MKPLAFWCRWNETKLLLHGRNPTAVWGVMQYWKENDRTVKFSFQLAERILTLGEEEAQVVFYLDEMGTLIQE